MSDVESIAGSKTDLNFDKGVELFDLTTDADYDCSQQKKKKTFQIDVVKHAKLPNEIFDYIHVARYQRLFSLA